MRRAGQVFAPCLAVLVLAGASGSDPAAADERAAQVVVGEAITVVARAVGFDILDAKGRPVDGIAAGDLELREDGVVRPILEVGRRAPLVGRETRARLAPEAIALLPVEEPRRPLEESVLVALDPTTLDSFAWRDALRSLAGAAETLVAMGPVEVVSLGTPVLAGIPCGREVSCVRQALEQAREAHRPQDLFYSHRKRFLREAQMMFSMERGGIQFSQERQREDRREWLRSAARQLVGVEAEVLDHSMSRLAAVVEPRPRPLVLVWVGGGDPLTGEFIQQFFNLTPEEVNDSFQDVALVTADARSLRERIEGRWRDWGERGVRVVSWAPERPLVPDLAGAEMSLPSRGFLQKLALDPIGLFEDAAQQTGGALVRRGAEIPAALESVRGRFFLVYQSDRAEPGYRQIEIVPRPAGWTVRAPRSLPVIELAPELGVELKVARTAAERSGFERLEIETRIDAAVLADAGRALEFDLRLSLTLASGSRVSRRARLDVPTLPLTGVIVHQLALELAAGARDLRVEVVETASGARGVATP